MATAVVVAACGKPDVSGDAVKVAAKPVAVAPPIDAAAPVVDAAPALPPPDPPSKRGPSMETVTVQAAIPGVVIHVAADGAAGWKLTVRNDTDDNVQLLWDESSFVSGAGASLGRIVPGNTRRGDVAHQHPPTPIAVHSSFTEHGVPEQIAEDSLFGYDFREQLDGGRLYIAIQIGSGKRTWVGTISESSKEPVGWWCFRAAGPAEEEVHLGVVCMRRHADCRGMDAADRLQDGEDVPDHCKKQLTAWCMVMNVSSEHCFGNARDCAHLQSKAHSTALACAERR
jgi:hypothetical protein